MSVQGKYDYVRGYCSLHKVYGFWPVLSVQENENGLYRHAAMACSAYGSEGCAKEKCRVLAEADEFVPKETEWQLREKKM